MENNPILSKLQLQKTPTILFTDIDGTLFSPNFNILTAPLFNTQTAAFLASQHIPFIIVTGRSFWRRIDQYHMKLLGVPKPDAVITANGTIIYNLERSGYVSDFTWQGTMQSTKVTDAKGNTTSWNKWEITNTIIDYLESYHFLHFLGKGNTYLIRIRFNKYPVPTIEQIRKEILQLFPKGIRIIFTEKLLWQNTTAIFSGEMLITPSTAGKDKAVQYMLKNLSAELAHSIHAFVFGDATVDIPMLTMKNDPDKYFLSQYAVRPTPLAQKVLQEVEKINPNLHILFGDGPKEILWTLRPELRKHSSPRSTVQSLQKKTTNYLPNGKASEQSNHTLTQSSFSPAQNNNARKSIQAFEKVLDNIVDKNLSPNEVSFLGLKKVSQGLTMLSKSNESFIYKTKGMFHYSFGNLTDILDGIRARNSDKKEENGQLVDGFSDRAKEFLQLFQRAKKRMESDEEIAISTFLACISCALPSIARSLVEISGKTVPERDEQGGSMIDRTKRLFLSLLFDIVGMPDWSVAKDLEIYTTNIATYQHRMSFVKKFDAKKIQTKELSKFQKEALERFLLYVDILQQEDTIIKKNLVKYPKSLREYKTQSNKLIKDYLDLSIASLRKKLRIKDYRLEVKKYLI